MAVRILNVKYLLILMVVSQVQGCTMVKRNIIFQAEQSENWTRKLPKSADDTTINPEFIDVLSNMLLVTPLCTAQNIDTMSFHIETLDNIWFGPLFFPIIPVSDFRERTQVNISLPKEESNCPKIKIQGNIFAAEGGGFEQFCSYSPEVPLEDFTISFEGKVGECQLPDIQYKLVKKETVIDWFWDFNG